MSKTALILNDTSAAYHWGCYGTSTELRQSLEDLGYTVTLFGVADVYALKTPPKNDRHLVEEGFRRVFLSDNPHLHDAFSQTDLVLVNGEGTLHGVSQAALNLLYISNLAKTHFHKQVHLVNTSLYPCDWRPLEENVARLYRDMLSPLDRLVVREPTSLRIAQEMGVEAHQGFDCLPRHLHRTGQLSSASGDGAIILGGGLGLSPEVFASFLKDAESLIQDRPLVYLTGAQGYPAQDDAEVIDALKSSGVNIQHQDVTTFEDWIAAIKNAACLVSGRFHHTIAAAFTGTPSLCFQAGTPKINGLCEALDFPNPIDSAAEDAVDQALHRLEDVLSHSAPTLSDEKRSEQLEQSAQNFADLDI